VGIADVTTPDQAKQKTLDYYLSLPYPILLVPDPEDGIWYAKIPLLQGCMTDGDTPAEALENLKDAMTGWLIVSLKHGDPIPEPEAPETYLGLK
jgi:predicted RNase H-like HicB family nuclease